MRILFCSVSSDSPGVHRLEPHPSQPHGASIAALPLLNPRPQVTTVPIFDDHHCIVIDDFMLEPDVLVDYAAQNHAHFRDVAGNSYPGPELYLSGTFAARVQDSFLQHARTPLGARRVINMMSRLSLVTRRPDELVPGQRLPHRDYTGLPAGEGVGAMVLYLFKDERLGGTSFFKPKVPEHEITALIDDLKRRERAGDVAAPDIPPTFAIASSRYFEKVLTIEPRYNRAIFYNGDIFHSGHIHTPELMVNDPRTGRLTVNAFFRVRKAAA
jgi:hypothetical protein